MRKLPKVIIITTPHCKACGNLIRDLVPLARKHKLHIQHLIAKRKITKSGKLEPEVMLYENGKKFGLLPEEYSMPEPRFPILIYESDPPLAVIGDKGVTYLQDIIGQNLKGSSIGDALVNLANLEETNIDSVVKEYESMPGSKVYGELIEYEGIDYKDS